jgi:hypothetical protein
MTVPLAEETKALEIFFPVLPQRIIFSAEVGFPPADKAICR